MLRKNVVCLTLMSSLGCGWCHDGLAPHASEVAHSEPPINNVRVNPCRRAVFSYPGSIGAGLSLVCQGGFSSAQGPVGFTSEQGQSHLQQLRQASTSGVFTFLETANMRSAQTAAVARPMSAEEKKVIFASSLGTVFEWYDF